MHEFAYAVACIRERCARNVERVPVVSSDASVAISSSAFGKGCAAFFAAKTYKRNGAAGTNTVSAARVEIVPADGACHALRVKNFAYRSFEYIRRFHFEAKRNVSRAMTSSSLVGMTYTFTLEESVDSLTTSPLGQFSLRALSYSIPR